MLTLVVFLGSVLKLSHPLPCYSPSWPQTYTEPLALASHGVYYHASGTPFHTEPVLGYRFHYQSALFFKNSAHLDVWVLEDWSRKNLHSHHAVCLFLMIEVCSPHCPWKHKAGHEALALPPKPMDLGRPFTYTASYKWGTEWGWVTLGSFQP